jgi:asparagine synthase (glutamine-hydrolysing)
MCGMAGIIKNYLSSRDIEKLADALEVTKHRGPDDEGYAWLPFGAKSNVISGGERTDAKLKLPQYSSVKDQIQGAGALFAHNRLSIIDLSTAGHQPMSYEDEKLWIVFNGEMYNYLELKTELESLGKRFTTYSDTEVILAAYALWGIDAVKRFVGMFSFALLDKRDVENPTLWLARDPFGIKPLYYINAEDGIAFCSEIKGLLRLYDKTQVNPGRCYEFLISGIADHEDQTMFNDIKQLLPGNFAKIKLSNSIFSMEINSYWHLNAKSIFKIKESEAVEEVQRLFLKNIHLHLRSDVPVGAALSGGIDSSAIVCAIRSINKDANLKTFSFISEDEKISEEKWMDLVIEATKAEFYKTKLNADDLLADLDCLVRIQDEPFVSTSIYAQYAVFRLAQRQGIKVMLDGQGADELMAGYANYPAARLLGMLTRSKWKQGLSYLMNSRYAVGGSGHRMMMNAAIMAAPASVKSMFRALAWSDRADSMLDYRWFEERGVTSRDFLKRDLNKDAFYNEMILGIRKTSLPKLLRYEDRNSMAFSIESRVPFLTVELAEFLLQLPDEFLIANDGTSKNVFRKAMDGIVPNQILQRRDKIGFATPEKSWLIKLRPWVENHLYGEIAKSLPMLRIKNIQQQWNDIINGQGKFDFRFWRLISTLAWADRYKISFN